MEINYTFNVNPVSQQPTRKEPAKRWMFVPHTFTPLPPDKVMVRSRIDESTSILMADVYGALEHCQSFRSFAEHTQEITRRMPSLAAHQAELPRILQQVAGTGLMIEEATYLESLRAVSESSHDDASTPIRKVFVRTCDRPEAVERLFDSIINSKLLGDSGATVTLIDDSRSTESQQQNRRLVDQHNAQSGPVFRYFGHEARETLITDLSARLPELENSVRFLLQGDQTVTAETPGIPLNLALLLSAGEKMALLDDDAVCESFASLNENQDFKISSRGRDGQLVQQDSEWQNPADMSVRQLFQDYGRKLGAPIASVLEEYHTSSDTLNEITLADLEHVQPSSRVLITGCGTVGDPGTGSNAWVFSEGAETLSKLGDTESEYNNNISNRNAWVGVSGLTLQPDYSLMTTTLTGIDNRELVPPTIPVFRNEDMMMGTLTQALFPTSLKLEYPVALSHLPIPRRHWEKKSTDTGFALTLGAFLPDYLQRRINTCGSRLAHDRLAYFGSLLTDLGHADPAYVRRELRDYLTRNHNDAAKAHMELLQTSSQLPPWVKKDLQGAAQRELQALSSSQIPAISELSSLGQLETQIDYFQQFARKMGEALIAWPAIRDAAIERKGKE
ncbi:MAG: hypothetical protein ACWA5Q_07800 [bacterium]